MAFPVTLHIYDVTTEGAVKALNKVFRAVGTGAFHAAVEVRGAEWSYGYIDEGSGVFDCEPKSCEMHHYRESLPMGETTLSAADIAALIERMSREWPGDQYDLLRKNCCNFSNAFCQELGVGPIPTWVTNLAAAGATLRIDGVGGAAAAVGVAALVAGPAVAVPAAAIIAAAKAGELDEKYRLGSVSAKAKDLLARGGVAEKASALAGGATTLAADVDSKLNISGKAATASTAASAAAKAAAARAADADAKFDISGKAASASVAAGAAAGAAAAQAGGMLGRIMSSGSPKAT